jgi:hypothetical protein
VTVTKTLSAQGHPRKSIKSAEESAARALLSQTEIDSQTPLRPPVGSGAGDAMMTMVPPSSVPATAGGSGSVPELPDDISALTGCSTMNTSWVARSIGEDNSNQFNEITNSSISSGDMAFSIFSSSDWNDASDGPTALSSGGSSSKSSSTTTISQSSSKHGKSMLQERFSKSPTPVYSPISAEEGLFASSVLVNVTEELSGESDVFPSKSAAKADAFGKLRVKLENFFNVTHSSSISEVNAVKELLEKVKHNGGPTVVFPLRSETEFVCNASVTVTKTLSAQGQPRKSKKSAEDSAARALLSQIEMASEA